MFVAVAGMAGMAAAQGRVVFNEVLYDPAGADAGLEKIELKNLGGVAVNLTGWELCVHGYYSGVTSFNGVTLNPGSILVVHLRLSGTNNAGNLYLPDFPNIFGGTTLDNGSDGVALYDCNIGGCFEGVGALNSMIDFVQWGITGQGVNQERHNVAADPSRPGGPLWSPAVDLDFAPQSGESMSIQYDGSDNAGGEMTLGNDFFVDNPTIGTNNPMPDCQVPGDCNDNVACTDDDCVFGVCVNTPNDANCPDGVFCNGVEVCDGVLGCVSPGDPCPVDRICDEAADLCKLPSINIALALVAGDTAPAELGADPLVSPIYLTHAGDGSGRLFIVDQIGEIRIVDNGVLLATPFLDVSASLPVLNTGFDERGLLGLAFHPNYAVNGRFFVRYSAPRTGDPAEPCFGTSRGCHKEILAEYAVSGGDANVADAGSEVILISVDEPEFNHNSGQVDFGPDGFLYFTLGDGGGGNDDLDNPNLPHGPIGNGQNPFTLLGSMHRIDVDSGSPYAIPVDNPFADGVAGAPETFAYGFRNPYRFSFDDGPGGDGALYVGDVGQLVYEEVDIVVNGGNYGWAIKEGLHCFDPFNPLVPLPSCNDAGMIDPVMEYTHGEGGISVIGGFVYRGGQFAELVGNYVFGDFSNGFAAPGGGRLYFFDTTGPNAYERVEFAIVPGGTAFIGHFLKGMGEDEDGEVYALASTVLGPTGTTGKVFRIVEPVCLTPADCNDDDVCTRDGCLGASCSHDPNVYGDIDGNGVIALADLFCVLDGFSGDFSNCTFEQDDIHGTGNPIACVPPAVSPCCPNGAITLGDLFAVLDAFGGEDPCCGG